MTLFPRVVGADSPQSWLDRCRDLDRDTVLRLLAAADLDRWGFSLTLDRVYWITDDPRAVRAGADDEHAVLALIGARVLLLGKSRRMIVDGWPPRDHVLTLFISSGIGRAFVDELRGGDR